jgi:carboxypeptidase Taq
LYKNDLYQNALADLRERLQEIDDLKRAAAVLNWDQSTYMPPGGASGRARQMATLEKLRHSRSTDPALGELLANLEDYLDQLSPENDKESDEAALIRVAKRDFDRATRIPTSLMGELANQIGLSYSAWIAARPKNDWATMRPILEKTLALSRRYAECFPDAEHIADPLIDSSDEGMTVATIRPLFAELRSFLTPLVNAIAAKPETDASCLFQSYPESKQWAFGEKIIRAYGYDFERGRQDKTHHPFMTRFSWGDCRITTRFDENYLGAGLFATLHEAGHALYEMGTDPSYDASPLGDGTSSGVHESQSRTWENVVGRSLSLWKFYYPQLQATFPEQLGNVDLQTFYHAINKVKPSLIRVEADEVTYNLHVIIRFELECELLEGTLAVADLPEAWRARYQEYLGVSSPTDADGVLQDVHWFGGVVGGAFQGYTLGNILSGQFNAAARKAIPGLSQQWEQGNFEPLHTWLRENIYRYGRKYTTLELVKRVTGDPIQLGPYKEYLTTKYSEIYGLKPSSL